jgi:Flp pilus assembly protein TadD
MQIRLSRLPYVRLLRRLTRAVLLLFLTANAQWALATDLTRAQQQWSVGQRTQAVSTLESALRPIPNDLTLRFALGVMRMELGDSAAAQAIFLSLTQDFPDLPDPFNNLAVIHAAQGELELARSELEQALRLQPEHAQAQENLGDLYLRLAARAYQRAEQVQLTPSASLAAKISQTQALMPSSANAKP